MLGKLDENMPTEATELLGQARWDCDTVYDEALSGAEDSQVIDRCRIEGRVLFTTDLDFADIRAYPPSDQVGIVVFRAPKPSRAAVLELLRLAIPVLASEWADHRLWIVEPGRVRIRSAGASAVERVKDS
jgi:predicted nuclease of predicted toxin-antitoxin system